MTAPQPIAGLVQQQTVPTTCGCGVVFEAAAVLLDGRWLAATLRCPACAEAHDATIRAAHERDAESRLNRRLSLVQRTEAERTLRRIDEASERLAVPPLYASVTLESYQHHGSAADQAMQRAALRYAHDWLQAFPHPAVTVTVFIGAPGSGKGHVTWSLARAVAARGHSARVIKLSDLVRALRASWGQKGGDDMAVLREFREVDCLVIDEVSRHAFYGQPVQHLYDVLDHRIEQLRPTILTSNETDDGLRAILSPALWNRIEGHGGIVEFGQASWRSRPR